MRSSGISRNTVAGKPKGKSNGSILNFFKKAESPQNAGATVAEEGDSLFFEDAKFTKNGCTPTQTPTPPRDAQETISDEATTRYNEDPFPSKRRRTDENSQTAPEDSGNGQTSYSGCNDPDLMIRGATVAEAVSQQLRKQLSSFDATTVGTPGHLTEDPNAQSPNFRDEAGTGSLPSNGPFVEDSESEDEMIKHLTRTAFNGLKPPGESALNGASPTKAVEGAFLEHDISLLPTLNREAISIVGGDGFDDMDDFIDDEFFAEGEEYMERVWMDEQEGLEFGEEENDMKEDLSEIKDEYIDNMAISSAEPQTTETCPLCSISLAGVPSDVGFRLLSCKTALNLL